MAELQMIDDTGGSEKKNYCRTIKKKKANSEWRVSR